MARSEQEISVQRKAERRVRIEMELQAKISMDGRPLSLDEIANGITQVVKSDNETILQKLPDMLNKEFTPNKWFNRITGNLADETRAERNGREVQIFSSPIGAAFDVAKGGELGWSSVSDYVKFRNSAGYMREYMRKQRAGQTKTGKFTGAKRLPFLLKATYKIDGFIKRILAEQSVKGEAA